MEVSAFITSCMSLVLLFLAASIKAEDEDTSASVIYYGDTEVRIGEAFEILCILSISEPVSWSLNGRPILEHNIRHGKDDHSFVVSEHPIHGENDRIESRLNVKSALKVHEGKYKCNALHSNYHYLTVKSKLPVHNNNNNSNDNNNNYYYSNNNNELSETFFKMKKVSSSSSSTTATTTTSSSSSELMNKKKNNSSSFTSSIVDSLNSDEGSLLDLSLSSSSSETSLLTATDTRQSIPRNSTTSADLAGIVTSNISSSIDDSSATSTTTTTTTATNTTNSSASSTSIKHTTNKNENNKSNNEKTNENNNNNNSHISNDNKNRYYNKNNNINIINNSSDKSSTSMKMQNYRTDKSTPPSSGTTSSSSSASASDSASASVTTTSLVEMNSSQMHHSISGITAKKNGDISDGSSNRQLVGFKIKQPLMLNCNVTVEGDFEVKWEKNGTDITQIDELKNRYKILNAERKLEISKTEEYDEGHYSCIVEGKTVQRKEFFAAAFLVARLPSNTNVVEGEKLTLHCIAIGTEPEIYWEYGNITIKDSTDRYIVKSDDKHKNAIFTIENVSLDDRGEYRCIIKNPLTDSDMAPIVTDTSYVRVKGKLAALWPFLGICAEVFILCAIILIYERRRNKAELEESDTDPNTEQ